MAPKRGKAAEPEPPKRGGKAAPKDKPAPQEKAAPKEKAAAKEAPPKRGEKAAASEPTKRGAKAAALEPSPPKRGGKAAPEEPPKRGAKAKSEPTPPPPKRGAPAAAPEEPQEDYESWPVSKLQARLKELGVTATGSKPALVARLSACAGAAVAKAAPGEDEVAEKPSGGTKRKAAAVTAEDEPVKKAASSSQQVGCLAEYEDGEFRAEYAKSGKSGCKECKENIDQGSLRLAKMVRSDKFDGKVPMWYHHSCFLNGKMLPRSTKLIAGFSTLRPEDQDLVRQKIPSGEDGDEGGADSDAIREQNQRVFEVQDALASLGEYGLKQMLELNGYPTQKLGVSSSLVELCADGIVFGATGKCEVCNDEKRGQLLLSGEAYKCTGWVNEFLKCTNRTQTPARTPWQLTEAAKGVAGGKLKKMRLTTGDRLFASKLREAGEEESVLAAPEKKGPLLAELEVAVTSGGGDNLTEEQVQELLKEHGGTYVEVGSGLRKATTCVVSTEEAAGAGTEEVQAATELGIPGVKDGFLTDSVEKGAIQEMGPYLLWGEARRLKKAIEEVVTSKFIEKDGVSMDADVGELAAKAHVLVDMAAKVVYSEMMNRTDLVSGGNAFYTLHLLEADDADAPEYWVFRKWGRIGVSQGGTKIEPFGSNKGKAIADFKKQYLDKTGNTFGHDRDSFVVKPGKFIRVDVQHKALGPPSKKAKTEGSGAAGEGAADQPLGKLSKAQIEKGEAVLGKLEAALGESLDPKSPAGAAKFMAFSAEFYSLIPHNFGLGKPPTINTADMVGAERALLQFYMRMGFEDMGGETDEKLTPIAGVMDLPLPKTLEEAAKNVCGAKDIKSCHTKALGLVKKKAGKPKKEMGPELYGSILLYTANAIYQDLNKCLRDEDRAKVSRYFAYLRLLFEACARLPQNKRTLWRGIGVDLSESYKVGSTIVWWGVSSCTSEKKVAEDFMKGCGDKATFLTVETETACDISELSFYSNEAESILLPGTQLKVLKSEKHGNKACITLKEVGRVVN